MLKSYTTLLSEFSEGKYPDNLDTMSEIAKNLILISERQTQMLAIAVSVTRGELENVGEWVHWAADELGLSGSYLHHLRKVGDMLVSLNDERFIQHYKRLFKLPYDKLLTISRITRTVEIVNFLNVNRVESMSRDEVRHAVNAWLHLDDSMQPQQPMLPGLDKVLDFIDDADADSLEEAFSFAAARPGKANKCLIAGMSLVSGCIAFYKSKPEIANIEFLLQTREAIADELKELDTFVRETGKNIEKC